MPKTLDHVLDRFNTLSPWTRFDEWIGIGVEVSEEEFVFAFFGEEARLDDEQLGYKLIVLRGDAPADQYMKYRSGEWIPEFGLDFGTIDGIRVSIGDDGIESYESCKPGQPPEELRLDEKQQLFAVLDAIASLIQFLDQDKVPILGEQEDYCYHCWKVAGTWRADVRNFPEEIFTAYPQLAINESRLKRISATKLPREGVWEASSFYLPATRVQGDQEMFVQCAGVAERNGNLLGLVTLEAHADPDQEIAEAILGSIETQKRMPEFLMVKEERVAERLIALLQSLQIHVRFRRRLKELERIREEMIDDFPDEESEEEADEQ
ncbi:MAG: hypothetical protein JST80_02820 [Bdellovibrionales bacterium]|nr:hypothetical protein [Bdellovibrionales bacterium]